MVDISLAKATLEDEEPRRSLSANARIERVVRDNYSTLWRLARRFGLSEADADDAAQRAVVILSQRLSEIAPGAERSFLCRTTLFLASNARRNQRRRGEEPVTNWDEIADRGLDPERLLARRRACAELDAILDELPEALRAAFVLFELELQSQAEVALALQIPQGTVASRVRRAREIVAAAVERRARSHQKIGMGR